MISQNHDQNIARMATQMLNNGELSQDEFDAYRNGTDPSISKRVASRYTDKLQNDVRNNAAIKDFASAEELKAKYDSDKRTIENMGGKKFDNRVTRKAETVGLGEHDRVINDRVKQQVQRQIDDGKRNINSGHDRVSSQASKIQNKVNAEQDKYLFESMLPDMPESLQNIMNMAGDGTHSGVSSYGGMPTSRGLQEGGTALDPTKKIIDSGSQSRVVDQNYTPSNSSGGQVEEA